MYMQHVGQNSYLLVIHREDEKKCPYFSFNIGILGSNYSVNIYVQNKKQETLTSRVLYRYLGLGEIGFPLKPGSMFNDTNLKVYSVILIASTTLFL